MTDTRILPYGPFLEEWRDIKDYEGYYQVSNYGRVKSLARYFMRNGIKVNLKTRILKSSINQHGYCYVALNKLGDIKSYKIHKLLASAFLGHKACGHKLVINHMFFDKTFNVIPYIEIVTQRENSNQKHLKSSSKYTGVCWDKQTSKWRALIRINGKSKCLGRYADELEASKAYEKALSNHLKQAS